MYISKIFGDRISLMAKSWRFFSAFFIGLILVIFTYFTVFNYCIPLYSSLGNAQWVEEYLSAHLGQSVTIGQISTQWRGFQPVVEINDFSILDSKGITALHIKHLRVGVDLFATFMKWKILPGDLSIEGSHLILKELPDGKLDINGIPSLQADLHAKNSEKLKYLIDCFLTTGLKTLHDVDVTWYNQKGQVVLPITKLTLYEHSHLLFHQYTAQASLWDQSPLSLKGTIYGSYLAKQLLYTKLDMNMRNIHLERYTTLMGLSNHFKVSEGLGALAMRLTLKPKQSMVSSGIFSGNSIRVQVEGNKIYELSSLNTHFEIEHQPFNWYLLFDQLNLKLAKDVLPIHKISFRFIQGPLSGTQIIKLDRFPVAKILQFAKENHLLPKGLLEAADGLRPSGVIRNFFFQRNTKNPKLIVVQGDLRHINFVPWGHFPGVQNLSGRLNFSPRIGKFFLNSSDSVLTYQPMFRFPIPIKKISGQMSWQTDSAQKLLIKIKNVAVKLDIAEASGYINILLGKNNSSPKIDSKFNFSVLDASQISRVYPVTTTPASVVKWLDGAIQGGIIDKGVFILNGTMKNFPFDQGKGKFLISGHLNKGKLHYLKGWPDIENIKAQLLFEGRSMMITSHEATTLGARISFVEARINNLERSILKINGQLSTLQNQTVKVNELNNPLLNFVNFAPLKNIALNGKWQLGLKLLLPLDKELTSGNKFTGKLNLENVTATTDNLSIEQLKGSLLFREDSVDSELLTGTLASNPFQITSSSKSQAGGTTTQIQIQSRIGISDIENIFKLKLINYLKGTALYKAQLTLTKPISGSARTLFSMTSNLQGIESLLPPPFNKSINSVVHSHFQVEALDRTQKIIFNYGHLMNGILAYKLKNSHLTFDRGHIQLSHQSAQLPSAPGLKLEGALSRFDVSAWKSLLSNSAAQNSNWNDKVKKLHTLINQINIKIAYLQFSGLIFEDAWIQTAHKKDALAFLIDSSIAKGEIQLPIDFPVNPLMISLQSFRLVEKNPLESKLSPSDIPPLNISIANFYYQDKLIKNFDLRVRPAGKNLIVQQATVKDPTFEMSASGIWREREGQPETTLKGNFESKNLGAILNKWQLTDNVVKGRGGASFNLSWTNTPFHPESKSLTGTVDLHFKEGRIIKLSSKANFGMDMGRVLTLFSLQTLPRRLMLDFSDLTEPGFSFDEMKGVLQFKHGDMFTENSAIDGPVAKVKLRGRIGLARKDYDLRLTINPYVTSSLPVVATLTAGPIVGAATWLVDKVFSHQVKKMTEIHYNVTGTWDNPDLKNLTENSNNG